MFNLLRVEWYKLMRNKTFWVLITFMATISFLLVFLPYLDEKGVFDQLDGVTIEVEDQTIESPQLSGIKIFLESLYSTDLFMNVLIMSVLGAFFIASEYANGTIKNLVSIGHSRRNIFFAKWVVLSIGSIIVIFSMSVVMGGFGTLFFGLGDWAENEILVQVGKMTFLSLVYFIAFLSIVMFFSIISRSSGVALLWSFGFYLLAGVGMNVVASSYSFMEVLNKYSVYHRYITFFENDLSSSVMIELTLIAVVTTLIFITLGMIAFQRKDLS